MCCELCKTKYPDRLQLNCENSLMKNIKKDHGKTFDLIDWEIEDEVPYVTLDCITPEGIRKENSKIIYHIKMIEPDVLFGRGQV